MTDINFAVSGADFVGTTTGNVTGTITVDYGTNTVTGGSLAYTTIPGGLQNTFTNFSLTVDTDPGTGKPLYTLASPSTPTPGAPTLYITWLTQTATQIQYLQATANGVRITGSSQPFVCFAEGTLIRTANGDVPVEALQIGDLVVTASGDQRPVKWLGHRTYRTGAMAPAVEIIRIAADAFGPARPAQDLVVSGGHSICVDLIGEILIPAGLLVNGLTVTRENVDEVTLWHVELESHDVLLANNLPAESYIAMGNRAFFDETGATTDVLVEGKAMSHADFCRPVVTAGPMLALVRDRLIARAKEIGWTPVVESDLHMLVDGKVRRPLIEGGVAVFLLPSGASDVRIMSNTFRPSAFGYADPRTLGIQLTGLTFGAANGEARPIDLRDARLNEGFFGVEKNSAGDFRWTNGAVVLDSKLWNGLTGPVSVCVAFSDRTVRGWTAPVRQDAQDSEKRPKLYAIR